MRPEGRGETDSLYFDYPQFKPPEYRTKLEDRTAVAIIGAGPVGMTAALALAREGVRSVLFDAKATFNDVSYFNRQFRRLFGCAPGQYAEGQMPLKG